MMAANTTFIKIKITNQDIYSKLIDIETQAKITNGKVKLNTLASRLSFTISLTSISSLIGIAFFLI